MDVKVIDVKASIRDLLEGKGVDQLLEGLREALKGKASEPVTEDEMRTNRDMIDLVTKKLASVSNRMEEATLREPDPRLACYMGQAHAYLNAAGRSLVDVVELLGEWVDKKKHDRECACVKPTDSPPADSSTVYASGTGEPKSAEASAE